MTVVNFLAADNEADRLTFEILAKKLDLFGRVLDASDVVLHEPSTDAPEAIAGTLALALEKGLARVREQSRTVAQMERGLAELSDEIAERRRSVEDGWQRAAGLIQSRLDGDVQRVFRRIEHDLPASLKEVDAAVEKVMVAWLESAGHGFERIAEKDRVVLDLDGRRFVVGSARGIEGAEPLHLGHPMLAVAVEDARKALAAPVRVAWPDRRGFRGRLIVVRVRHAGFEPVDRLLALAVGAEEAFNARPLMRLPMEASGTNTTLPEERIADAIEEAVFLDQEEVEVAERARFEAALARLERSVEDRALLIRRKLADIERKSAAAAAERDRTMSSETREAAQRRLRALDVERSEASAELEELDGRTDAEYRRRRDALTGRRMTVPVVERLVDVALEIL